MISPGCPAAAAVTKARLTFNESLAEYQMIGIRRSDSRKLILHTKSKLNGSNPYQHMMNM